MQAIEPGQFGLSKTQVAPDAALVQPGVVAVFFTFVAMVLAIGLAFQLTLSGAIISALASAGAGGLVYVLSLPLLRRFPSSGNAYRNV